MPISFRQRIFITADVRREWYEVLASMTGGETRMNVSSVLKDMLREFQEVRHPMAPVVRIVIMRMTGGRSNDAINSLRLGDSLKGLVPENEAMMIKAGEENGDLSRGLAQAAFYVGSSDQLMDNIRGALAMFGLYSMAIMAINIFFAYSLLPKMEMTSPRVRWPVFAQAFGWVADHMIVIALVAVVGALVALWGMRKIMRNWTGPRRDFFDAQIWPFTTARLINASALLMSLSGFVKAGVPFVDAMSNVSTNATPYMLFKYRIIRRSLKDGRPDYEALLSSRLIPRQREWIVRSYGKTSDFGRSLDQESRDFMKFAVKRTAVLSKRLNFIFMCLVAANALWVGATLSAIVKSVR